MALRKSKRTRALVGRRYAAKLGCSLRAWNLYESRAERNAAKAARRKRAR